MGRSILNHRRCKIPKRNKRAKARKAYLRKLKEKDISGNKENAHPNISTILEINEAVFNSNQTEVRNLGEKILSVDNIVAVPKDDNSFVAEIENDLLEYSFISEEEYESIMQHEIEKEVSHEINPHLQGYRIVDLQYVLEWSMKLQLDHSKICTTGQMKVVGEERSGLGLVSCIIFTCNMCNYTTKKLTEKSTAFSKLNVGAVWGTIATGSTYAHLSELLSTMDVPAMSSRKYSEVEKMLGTAWKNELYSTLEDAGKQEYFLAKQNGQVDANGNVWTTVYVEILYSSIFTTDAIQYGLKNESVALQRFMRKRPTAKIRTCGIFVDNNTGFLAASPDALVGANGIIEIKCLHAAHKSGKQLNEFIDINKNCCLEKTANGTIQLKRNHHYYYQVQGQLNITEKDICYFICYIDDKQELFVEVILKDKAFWKNQMVPKLTSFYLNYCMPEIIYRNIPKGIQAINDQINIYK